MAGGQRASGQCCLIHYLLSPRHKSDIWTGCDGYSVTKFPKIITNIDVSMQTLVDWTNLSLLIFLATTELLQLGNAQNL